LSEAYPASLAAGLPRIGEYFHKLAPTLHWRLLFDGVTTEGSLAYWFYRLDSWSWLLFQTVQMAALATFGGAVAALLLCWAAAANLAPIARSISRSGAGWSCSARCPTSSTR